MQKFHQEESWAFDVGRFAVLSRSRQAVVFAPKFVIQILSFLSESVKLDELQVSVKPKESRGLCAAYRVRSCFLVSLGSMG